MPRQLSVDLSRMSCWLHTELVFPTPNRTQCEITTLNYSGALPLNRDGKNEQLANYIQKRQLTLVCAHTLSSAS